MNGTFSKADREYVARKLRLTERDTLRFEGWLKDYVTGLVLSGRPQIANDTAALDWLTTVDQHARSLSAKLKEYNLTRSLLFSDPRKFLGTENVVAESAEREKILLECLADLASGTARFLDDDALRGRVFATKTKSGRQKTHTRKQKIHTRLWPVLFDIWASRDRTVAHTPDGPLHEFLKIIHRVFEFDPPSARSLRDATDDWKAGRGRVTTALPSFLDGYGGDRA